MLCYEELSRLIVTLDTLLIYNNNMNESENRFIRFFLVMFALLKQDISNFQHQSGRQRDKLKL